MGSTADKIAGLTNEAVGKVKQGAGKAVGDKLRVEGAAQEAKGAVRRAIGEAKAATKDAANKAGDVVTGNLRGGTKEPCKRRSSSHVHQATATRRGGRSLLETSGKFGKPGLLFVDVAL